VKGAIIGAVGVCGVSAAVVGGSGGGPDDFTAVLSKPPSVVYAAFAELGPEGENSVVVPKGNGFTGKFTQRLVKVANEQVKLEVLIDDEALLTAEVQLAPDGSGTRLAAELDFNEGVVRRLVEESGQKIPMPPFALQDFLIDQVFAHAMTEMVDRIEAGKPLLSLADTRDRWGRGGGGGLGTFSETSAPYGSNWAPPATTRPQMSTSPTLNPEVERQRPSGPSYSGY
jgi:hypothetical protein